MEEELKAGIKECWKDITLEEYLQLAEGKKCLKERRPKCSSKSRQANDDVKTLE